MLREKAYARFQLRLFDGDLKPGQFVSQRELCAVVDMKIGPVRDALKQLQAEALVKVIPQRGIQIADVKQALGSLRRMCEAGSRVAFDDEGSYVENTDTGERAALV